jgi:threonine aldolase
MADAEVGDDVLDGDPTVRRLEARVCELLGKERALFFPTGTMANVAALWLLARRGTDVLLDGASHVMDLEHAAAAALVGVQTRAVPLGAGRLVLDAAAVADALAVHAERASLVCLENTHNGAGGVVTSAAELEAIGAVVRRHGLPLHLDGARLWNAAVTACTSEERLAAASDTVMVSFAKGLGAPVGAALAGPAALLADAVTVRRRLGGGMRQSGVIAAAALYGVTHHRARLADDHEHAQSLARAIDGAGGARVVPPETNIVMIDLPRPAAVDVAERAAALGVRLSVWTPTRLRAVTHLDVDADAVRRAGELVVRALEAAFAA